MESSAYIVGTADKNVLFIWKNKHFICQQQILLILQDFETLYRHNYGDDGYSSSYFGKLWIAKPQETLWEVKWRFFPKKLISPLFVYQTDKCLQSPKSASIQINAVL